MKKEIKCPNCGELSPWTMTGFYCFSKKCQGQTFVDVPHIPEAAQGKQE